MTYDARDSMLVSLIMQSFVIRNSFIGYVKHYSRNAGGTNTKQLECGQMPNVMVALPNIGSALCSTPQSLADAHY